MNHSLLRIYLYTSSHNIYLFINVSNNSYLKCVPVDNIKDDFIKVKVNILVVTERLLCFGFSSIMASCLFLYQTGKILPKISIK